MYWDNRVDFIATWKPLLALVVFLSAMQLCPNCFSTVTTYNTITGKANYDTRLYQELQFMVFFIVMTITMACFNETFRTGSIKCLGVYKLGIWRAVLSRYLVLLLLIETLYLPFVTLSFARANASIAYHEVLFGLFPNSCPRIKLAIPIFQCATAMIFYVTSSLFFLSLFRNMILTMVIMSGYAVWEVLCLAQFYPQYAIFRNCIFLGVSGQYPDLGSYFHPNTQTHLILSILMLCFTLVIANKIYGVRSYR